MRDIMYIVAGGTLTVGSLLAYFVPSWLNFSNPTDRWVLTGGLAILVVVAVAAILWFFHRRQQAAAAAPAQDGAPPPAEPGGDELDLLFREAEQRLQGTGMGRNARIGNLPVILVLGEPGSTKTSTVTYSGLEPELLAGQVYQETSIVPTRAANFWFTQKTVLVEAGGKLISDPTRWGRLLRRLAPGRLGAVAGKSELAPRAAIICFDTENFTRPGGADAVTVSARNLQARLGEISQSLGISFPVYVLFTKMDRISFFAEYVRNLNHDEVNQVFGVTLPIQEATNTVYAEQQTERLSAAFNQLFHSTCDKRLDFLPRENDQEKVPGAYEFPREFGKLRKSIVQFLVDLCRPSQLRTNPFLRGFYFSGVRAVLVSDAAVPGGRVGRAPGDTRSGATGMFRSGGPAPAPAAVAPSGTRKVPQWLFLSHLFHHVIFQDRAALGASGASTRANSWQRALWIAAAALCFLFAIVFTVSYFGNRSLERQALEAARGIAAGEGSGAELASLDALRRLDTLRQSVETLSRYERDGSPWRLHWGLYTGSELYPIVRRVYFNSFHRVLFNSAQGGLVRHMRSLPASPDANADYMTTYRALRAYLMTSANHEKVRGEGEPRFLAENLYTSWAGPNEAGDERARLARVQFDFYCAELALDTPFDSGSAPLPLGHPFSTRADADLVARTRDYLRRFDMKERVYRSMLNEVSRANSPVSFAKQFPPDRYPGFHDVVLNKRVVDGAFTRNGWNAMQAALGNIKRYVEAEPWVLPVQAGQAPMIVDSLGPELRERYRNDYLQQWRQFLRDTAIAPYKDPKDAAQKLNVLNGQAPLMALFWLVSRHASAAPELSARFQPPLAVVPAETPEGQFRQPKNESYMQAMINLQGAVEMLANSAAGLADPGAAGQTQAKATDAKTTARAFIFNNDPEGRMDVKTRELLLDPIRHWEDLIQGVPAAELNKGGQDVCGQFKVLKTKYPFNPNWNAPDATLDEVNRLFRPADGLIWKFVNEKLPALVERQGSHYQPKPGANLRISSGFLGFLNNAAAFTDAVYPGGAQQPRLAYTINAMPIGLLDTLILSIDGKTLSVPGKKGGSETFAWPGQEPHGTRLGGKTGGSDVFPLEYSGLWSAFRWFGEADKFEQAGTVYNLEFRPMSGGQSRQPIRVNNQPLVFSLTLDMKGAPPIFRRGFFAGWACSAEVATR